jgi:hypothetical protein
MTRSAWVNALVAKLSGGIRIVKCAGRRRPNRPKSGLPCDPASGVHRISIRALDEYG